jgi:hypothetical protein
MAAGDEVLDQVDEGPMVWSPEADLCHEWSESPSWPA